MNMAFFILLTVLLANLHGYSFSTDSGENVKVTDEAPCVADKEYTLSCKLKELRSAVEWWHENDLIADCSKDFCGLNPVFKGQYDFKHDFSENYFNLTILHVPRNFDRKKFVCSDGSYSDCRILSVGETQLEEINDSEYITAKSACCSQDRKAVFKWIKIDPVTNKSEEFKPKKINIPERCSHDCGGNQNMKVNQVISVKRNGTGKKYYLKVEATYGSKMIESSITTNTYEIEELAADTKSEESEAADTKSEECVAAKRFLYTNVGIFAMLVFGVFGMVIIRYRTHLRRAIQGHHDFLVLPYCRKKRNPGKDTVDVEESFINADQGTSPCSNIRKFESITIQQCTPEPVDIVPCSDHAQPDQYLVSWKHPQNSSDDITSYTIKYGKIAVETGIVIRYSDHMYEHYIGDVKEVQVKPTTGEFRILDLQAATHYRVEITANAQNGMLSEPRSHIFRTADGKKEDTLI